MKPVLVIGSTCVDIIIRIPHLPVTQENLHPASQSMTLGGCAYNVANILRQAEADFCFVSPVGGGMYGDYVAKALEQRGFSIPIRVPEEENGCCYCLVEDSGERTFMSYHGVEYCFRKEWMAGIRAADYSMVYICGLEVEEPTGEALVEWLEENRGPEIFFAPGPRVLETKKERIERLLALHPVLHINELEAKMMSGCEKADEAAVRIRERSGNTVIITLGSEGAYCLPKEGEGFWTPGCPAKVADTIGAGDSHIGAVMAALSKGMDLKAAIAAANQVSSAVVSVDGASLPDEKFRSLGLF